MEKLKRLALSLTLMSVLSASAVAGETNSPPCSPGETHSPPCPTQSVNEDPLVPGETSTPPALSAVYVTDIAETLLWSLLLF
jgi:hypothetical protein